MKATGIIRYIDDLGRTVIPKDVRRELNIKEGDQLEIFTEGESVIFKKYAAAKKSEGIKMTNYERIKSMSIVEMANFLTGETDSSDWGWGLKGYAALPVDKIFPFKNDAFNANLKWLESEVSE